MREIDLGCITAYGDAKKAGFDGSYSDFCSILASLTAGSGVTSYLELSDKPRINGIELVGNMTSEDLGLHTRGSRVEITTASQELFGKTVILTDGDEIMESQFDNNGKCVFESVLMGGTMIASASANGKTCRAYVQCPYFTNYKTSLTYSTNDVYSVIIDHSGDGVDDMAMVTYADSATGRIAGGDDWLINEPFSLLKPCVMVNGEFQTYVDMNDSTKTADGNPLDTSDIDISSLSAWMGSTADYMFNQYVEIPCMGIKANWLDDDRLYLSIAVGEGENGYDYSAFEYDGGICDKIYLGRKAYQSGEEGAVYAQYIDTGTLYSLTDDRENYGMMGYSQFELLQYLLILYYKRLRIPRNDADMFGFYNVIPTTSASSGITYPTKSVFNNSYLKAYANITATDKLADDNDKGLSGYMKKPYGIVGKTFLCKEAGASASTFYGATNAYANCTKPSISGGYVDGYYQCLNSLYQTVWHPRSEKATTRNGQTGVLGHQTNLRSMIMHKKTT